MLPVVQALGCQLKPQFHLTHLWAQAVKLGADELLAKLADFLYHLPRRNLPQRSAWQPGTDNG